LGREEPLIFEILTTALEKSLPNIIGKSRILKIHSPPPGNFPIAVIHLIKANFSKRPILLKNSIIWMGEFPVENQINLNFTC